MSADWWHIDMRDIVTTPGAQFLIEQNNPAFVQRVPPIPGTVFGPVQLVLDLNQNLSGAVFEGLDYEGIYILDSTVFGGSDWGRVTTTVNGTWLARAEFQPQGPAGVPGTPEFFPGTKRIGIAGSFLPPGFALTSSLPWHRANFSVFYDGPADTWMQGWMLVR